MVWRAWCGVLGFAVLCDVCRPSLPTEKRREIRCLNSVRKPSPPGENRGEGLGLVYNSEFALLR